MKNKFTRLICVFLSVLVTGVLVCGCAVTTGGGEKKVIEPMEKEEINTVSFAITGGKDVMPIGGFYGPHHSTYNENGQMEPDMITDEYFKIISEAGVNFISYSITDYKETPQLVIKMLQLAEKYNIGVFVRDTEITNNADGENMTTSEMSERINNYSNYPAFCGVYVVDEPTLPGYTPSAGTKDIDRYVPILESLDKLDIVSYTNLFPTYIAPEKLDEYPNYVETFLKSCKVPYLLFDHYVFDEERNIPEYFYNLSVIRSYAQEYNIPFWTFIQAGSQWNDDALRFDSNGYYPNEKQFDWNINTSLAYGAQGFQYFPLIQPVVFAYAKSTTWDFERNALIGAWGNKTRWYYYAQNISSHIEAIDEVLMNAKNKGVIVSGRKAVEDNKDSNCIIEGTSWRELDHVKGDALIGCFNYQGKTALYVVNYDMKYAQDITLEFYDKCKFSVIQNAEKTFYNGEEIKLSMQAGEGALIVFE